jgi:hypothetical protein
LTTPESESNVIHARVHTIPDDATALKPSAIISGQPEVQPTNMVGAPHQVPHSSVTPGDNASTRPQGSSDSFFSKNTSATSKEAYGPPSECQQPITVIIRRSQQQSNPNVPLTNSRDSLSLPRLHITNSQTELSSVGSQHTHLSSTNDPQSPFSSAVVQAQLQQSGPRPGSVKPKGRRSRSARSTQTSHTSTPQSSTQNPLTTHDTRSGQSQPLSGPVSSASKLQGPRPRQDSLSPIDRWADEHAAYELSSHPKQTLNNPLNNQAEQQCHLPRREPSTKRICQSLKWHLNQFLTITTLSHSLSLPTQYPKLTSYRSWLALVPRLLRLPPPVHLATTRLRCCLWHQ